MSESESPSPPPSTLRRLARVVLRLPALVAVAIYFLIDDVVLAAFRPLVAWASGLRLFLRLALVLRRLPPYPTLILFLVPFVVLEPFKVGGLWLMATGRFRAGLIMLVVAHVLSIVLVERLFHATREKLLTIGWFAWVYGRVMRLYDWSLGRLRETAAWTWARRFVAGVRARVRRAIVTVRRSDAMAWMHRRIADARLWLIHLRIRLRRR